MANTYERLLLKLTSYYIVIGQKIMNQIRSAYLLFINANVFKTLIHYSS